MSVIQQLPVCDSILPRPLTDSGDELIYTCCVCWKLVTTQDNVNIISSAFTREVCSKMCAQVLSQTVAFVQGFVLCKVLSILIDEHSSKLQARKEIKQLESIVTERAIKVETVQEPEEVSVAVSQENNSSLLGEPVSFHENLINMPFEPQQCFTSLHRTGRRGSKRQQKSQKHQKKLRESKKAADYADRCNQQNENSASSRPLKKEQKEAVLRQSKTADAVPNTDRTADLTCPDCGKKFSTRKTMKAHLQIKHKKDISRNKVCRICGQGFSRQVGLSLHMANKHRGEKAVECETCGERFASSTDCDRHMTLVHGKQRGVCHICGKHFKYLHTLQAHVKAHTGVRAFVCEICGKGFLRQTTLLDHKKRHFCKDCKKDLTLCECPRAEKKRIIVEANGAFQCRFCGAVLQTFDLFEAHVAAHKLERPYGCSMCDKRFMEKTGLRAHMHQHREKRFQCDVCQKTFTYKCNLKHHRENHNVEGRPYPCDICQKTFKTETALKVHKDVHSEERRVNCHICGKSLTRVTNLKRHLKVMHPESVTN